LKEFQDAILHKQTKNNGTNPVQATGMCENNFYL
jgi:hypothetical protein